MAYISTFVYAESSIQEMTPKGPKLHIVSPIQVFLPRFIPGTFSFGIVFGILDYDATISHNIQVKFINSKEETLVDTGKLNLPISPINNVNIDGKSIELPKDMRGSMMNMNFQNVVFREEGIYKTQIIFDNKNIGNYQVKVKGVEKL